MATTQAAESLLTSFARIEKDLARDGRDWLQARRKQAIDAFAANGLPTTRDEEWKYTSVKPIASIPFQPALGYEALAVAELEKHFVTGLDGPRLAFVDGHFAPELSRIDGLPPAVRLMSLARVLAGDVDREWLAAHLATLVGDEQAFAALNTAFMLDGACLHVPRGVRIEAPVQLLFVAGAAAGPLASHPRNLIVADETSQVTVVEIHAALAGSHLTNAVTEIFAGPSATVEHLKLQQAGPESFHVHTIAARGERDANLTQRSFALGGPLTRNDINVTQAASGIDITLDGLFVVNQREHVDHHTRVDHAHPHGTSNELYKGVIDGAATGVFNGLVLVRPGAQKTDSTQTNRNLLLSGDAVIETKPELEIFADDVKCAHGATIGQLDETSMFYLRSRGIDPERARNMLIYAFASEVIARTPQQPIRRRLEEMLFDRLPGGDLLQEVRS